MVKKYLAKVEFNDFVTEKVLFTRLRLGQTETVEFKGGQFLSIKLPYNLRRSYSISSAPENKNYLETYVDISPNGPGSNYFNSLRVGMEVEFLAPLGNFIFKESIVKTSPAIFLATGTGITPFISMLNEWLPKSSNPAILYWGLRFEKDVFLKDELERMKSLHSNFDYKICLSKPSENWTGEKGYCTEELIKNWNKIAAITTGSFYLCGAEGMIEKASDFLLNHQIGPSQIFHEKFY